MDVRAGILKKISLPTLQEVATVLPENAPTNEPAPLTSPSGPSPDPVAVRVEDAARKLGANPLIDWATRLLSGTASPQDDGDPDIELLGGMPALEDWMARVWAAQVLLHRWHHAAAPAVLAGLDDEAWQVRSVCVKVAALRGITEAELTVVTRLDDPEPTVRVDAATALGELGSVDTSGTVIGLGNAVMSTDSAMADAAERALERLAERFDRPDIRPSSQY